ncbi:hypothetical protein OKA06_14570 [Novosphingobium sp. MW5]|nr:hypothetical protein [Novosphingobium sp. MW5]
MKLQGKALIRNLVIGVIAVDAVGIYMLKDRLSDPSHNSVSALEQEALALSASPAAQSPNHPPLPGITPVESPKAAASPEALASRELPKPAFGTAPAAPAAPAAAPKMVEAPRAVAAPAPAKAKPAAAPALAKAPVAAVTPARPAAKAAPQTGFVAKRTITVPRVASAASTKAPVTVSTKTMPSPKFGKVAEHKRASFTKAFGVSHAKPSVAVIAASGSLLQSAPMVTAEFAPDATQPAPEAVEVTTLAVATPVDAAPSPAPTHDAPVQMELELPARDQ